MSDKNKAVPAESKESPRRIRAPLTELQAMSRTCLIMNDLSIPQAERILAWLSATLAERKDAAKPKEPS